MFGSPLIVDGQFRLEFVTCPHFLFNAPEPRDAREFMLEQTKSDNTTKSIPAPFVVFRAILMSRPPSAKTLQRSSRGWLVFAFEARRALETSGTEKHLKRMRRARSVALCRCYQTEQYEELNYGTCKPEWEKITTTTRAQSMKRAAKSQQRTDCIVSGEIWLSQCGNGIPRL